MMKCPHLFGFRVFYLLTTSIALNAQPFQLAGDHLNSGGKLLVNHYIQNSAKTFYLLGQLDGNFVVYAGSAPQKDGEPTNKTGVYWHSATHAAPPPEKGAHKPDAYMTLLPNGDLQVVGHRRFSSETAQFETAAGYFLILENNGSVSVYDGKYPNTSTLVWRGSMPNYKGAAIPYWWEVTVHTPLPTPTTWIKYMYGTQRTELERELSEEIQKQPPPGVYPSNIVRAKRLYTYTPIQQFKKPH